MLMSHYSHSIDKKGRLIVPVKFREEFERKGNKKFILTKGEDVCLKFISYTDWEKQIVEGNAPLENSSVVRAYNRQLIGFAVECEFDTLGRIMIPPALQQFAGIKKDVILVGQIKTIEIWDRATWNKYINDADENSAQISEEIAKIKQKGKGTGDGSK